MQKVHKVHTDEEWKGERTSIERMDGIDTAQAEKKAEGSGIQQAGMYETGKRGNMYIYEKGRHVRRQHA